MIIKGTTVTAGLLGYPVEHTKSPLIHNTLAGFWGDDLVYLPFCVKNERLKEAVEGAAALGICGLNVTVPHKSSVIEYLNGIDPLAKEIGAVNTLCAVYEGSASLKGSVTGYKGFNTDILGLAHAMNKNGFEVKGRPVLILGAGGAARAVAFLAMSLGAESITIANRSPEKAADLAGDINRAKLSGSFPVTGENKSDMKDAGDHTRIIAKGCGISELDQSLEGSGYLCIQCTSVGLYPNIDACPIEDEADPVWDRIEEGIDLIYKPAETVFMKRLAAKGKKTMNGLSMLLYQGVIAYEMFTLRWNGELQTPGSVLDEIADKLNKAE